MTEGNDRLKVPGILIERHAELYAALEPSEVEVERARPELFHYTAYWRLLLRRGEGWDDAGYATSQTESGRGFLQRRVLATIGTFDGKVVEEFRFRMTLDAALPPISGRTPTGEIDSADPVVARLRGICHEVANTVTNAQQGAQVLHAFSGGAEYVIEMKDGFDYSDYYIPVMPGQDPQEIIARETKLGMQRFMGILSRERAEQMWPELATGRVEPGSEASTPAVERSTPRGSSRFGGIRRAVLLALAWGVAWAPLGVLTGLILDSDGAMDEPWIAIGVYPGFLSALIFSAVLSFTDARRGLHELPIARAAARGALAGLIVILPPVAGLLGTPNTGHVLWRGRFVIIAVVTLLSAVSAVASVLLARKAKERS